MRHTTRRRLLGAGAATGLAAATGGCLGILGGDGDDGNEDGDGDPDGDPDDGTPEPDSRITVENYRGWFPEPQEFQGDDQYSFFYYDVAGFQDREGDLHSDTYTHVEEISGGSADLLDVEMGDLSEMVRFIGTDTRVVTGEFDADAVAGSLEAAEYREHEEHAGHRIYVGDDPAAVAVGPGTAAFCHELGPNSAVETARILLDAGRGEVERYHEVSEEFDLVTRDLTDVTHAGGALLPRVEQTNVQVGEFAGSIGFGTGFTVGSSDTVLQYTIVFDSEEQAAPDDVETWATDHYDAMKPYRDLDVTADGRTVTIEASIPTGQFDFLSAGSPGE